MKIIADANIPFVSECFSSIGEVVVLAGRDITAAVVRDADMLIVRSITKVGADLLAGSSVRFVATSTIGTDHIDVEYLRRSNIGFAYAPGSNANSVAEYIVAGLLEIEAELDIDLRGKSIGIVGVGNVGSRVAKKAESLGMEVLLNDPPLRRRTGEAKYLPLGKLFDCDFLTLHTPLTFTGADRTFHLADEKFFNSLKAGCVFLNTSRGAVVETAALKQAVSSAATGPVVLDVWENEPDIDTELLEMAYIGTPHIAGYSFDGKVEGMIMIYRTACEYFGLEAEFDADSFLPAAGTAELKLENNDLRTAVRKIYNIKADDTALRQITKLPTEEQGAFFDKLRKEYPIRREFQNTKIVTDNKTIAQKLVGIGFKGK